MSGDGLHWCFFAADSPPTRFVYASFNDVFGAWVAERCAEFGTPERASALIADGYTWMFLGELAAGIASISLYQLNLAWMSFVVGAIVCAAGLFHSLRSLSGGQEATPSARHGWKERFAVARTVGKASRTAATVIVYFGCMMLLVNVVEYLWPVALVHKIGDVNRRGLTWMGMLVALSSIRWLGARFVAAWSTRAEGRALERTFVGVGAAAALAVIVLGLLTQQGSDAVWMLASVVLLVVFAHGVMAPGFEVLVVRKLPPSLAPWRATVLSLGSLVRSVLVLVVVVPTAAKSAAVTASGWSVPGGLVLIAAVATWVALTDRRSHSQPIEEPSAERAEAR